MKDRQHELLQDHIQVKNRNAVMARGQNEVEGAGLEESRSKYTEEWTTEGRRLKLIL